MNLPGRGQQHGGVAVVAAGVDHGFLAVDDKLQGVHIRPQAQHRPFLAGIDGDDDSGPGHAGLNILKADLFQLLQHKGRCLELLKSLLRDGVQIIVHLVDICNVIGSLSHFDSPFRG